MIRTSVTRQNGNLRRAALLLGIALAGCAHAAQGTPDFSGIWSSARDPAPAAAAGAEGAPAGRAARQDQRGEFMRTAPYTAVGRAKVTEYAKLVAPSAVTPGAFCLGHGMPQSILAGGGYPMEIIQRPEQITIIQEAHSEVRRIYTDGRKVDPKDLVPERSGFSTGHWEGDTLVVETVSLTEAIDQYTAHSEEAKVVERFRLTTDKGVKRLTVDVTMTDPVFYTKPVSLSKSYEPSRSKRIMSYDCNEPAWHEHLEKLRTQSKESQ